MATEARAETAVCPECRDEPMLVTCGTCKADQDAVVDNVSTGSGLPGGKADAEFELFIDACRHDAYTHGGFVAVNRVRAALSNEHGLTVNPRRYSSFWRRAQLSGHLDDKYSEEKSSDGRSRNLNKKSRIYRWLGARPSTT